MPATWILNHLFEKSEQVLDAVHVECRLTKDKHDFNDWPANLKVMRILGSSLLTKDDILELFIPSEDEETPDEEQPEIEFIYN